MNKLCILFIAALCVCACRPAQFHTGTLTRNTKKVESYGPSSKEALADLSVRLKHNAKKFSRLTVAFIKGSYRLPDASPIGGVYVQKDRTLFSESEKLALVKSQNEMALKELSGDDALATNEGINAVLESGLKVKELSFAEALQVAKAEEGAKKDGHDFVFGKTLLPEVDILVSFFKADSEEGPVLVGRALKNDGTLLSFRVFKQETDSRRVSELLITLVNDALLRIK